MARYRGSTVGGEDVFVIAETGLSKSLFQCLPPYTKGSLVSVISPLTSRPDRDLGAFVRMMRSMRIFFM
jgi:hypothetical protein